MRLLSIFALLFLISFLLHGGLKDRSVPVEQAGQSAKEVADAADAVDVPNVAAAADVTASPDGVAATGAAEPAQVEPEDFSSLIFEQPYPVGHFDFEREHVFSTIEIEIKNLIIGRNNDSYKVRNNLCAVGYEFPPRVRGKRKLPAKKEVIVYWKEAKTLYRWSGGNPKAAEQDFYNARSLMDSQSIPLDPNRGAVGGETGDASEDNKKRAKNVIADCETHGKSYEIEAFRPPERGFWRPEGGGRPRPRTPVPPTPAPESAPAETPPPPPEPAPATTTPPEPAPAATPPSPVV